ncbi:hypothetical protein N5923_19490 [Erwiniaceae bacterium BAC15a-03b]|uniref:Uncharacterized protein n=1 Tax=Winslowiella arboricola TaxID=2978220 RepID=A0A9J6PTA7_9GAMM|nr:hypothetical protein [Winslowiella arboricola]MCU5775475.1 hypothetical protein [Winslowiella arboricola]MCU5779675.1 hypothetical protein [Winslowiella arboricola]
MSLDIIMLTKSVVGGAGLGFALLGGVSMVIPSLNVTTEMAYFCATAGAILAAVLVLKGMVK